MGRPSLFSEPMTARERQRRRRARLRAEAASTPAPPENAVTDPVGALAAWSASTLRVPAGHPLAGEPMTLPPFAVSFLRAGWGAHEGALCVARKNSKSAICAVLALGHLCGPLRTPGWRGAVCSVSREKAAELRAQVEAIAKASGLEGLRFRKAPYPGKIESATGSLEVLSSDRTAGHASGYDVVIVDETGLMPERARDLLAGLRSSVSAKAGRVMHISVRGDSPLYREVLNNPATVAHVYAAPNGCAIDDEEAWAAANPGLACGIKSFDYMRDEVARIRGAPGDEPSFRSYDLNQPLDPTREMLCSPDDLRACFVEPGALPARSGACVLGVDAGEATSATAACAIWPETGRVEMWMGFGDNPSARERGRRDDAPYPEMVARGELKLYPGRTVDVGEFLSDVREDLAGSKVRAVAADGYKDAEFRDWLDRAGARWKVEFRRVGAGKDGGRDVRTAQRLVINRKLRMVESLALATAISKSTLRRDGNGNPGLDRATSRGRIDLLSAFVIACGLAGETPPRGPRIHVVGHGRRAPMMMGVPA